MSHFNIAVADATTMRPGDQDRAKYAAIGESDRMTLKFVKPANP